MSARFSQGAEQPISPVRGTRDWLPADFARLGEIESLLLDRFARAGFARLRTPVLEFTELHERKSGAGVVSKLYELTDSYQSRLCLRPELTAGIVRAYTGAAEPPETPWRVSHSGPVFRFEPTTPGRLREFQQVGVELRGGPLVDAEIIGLADWAAAEAGVRGATIRLGHVGLILEMLDRSSLPAPARAALVEMLSEAAAEGRDVRAIEMGLEQLAGWLQSAEAGEISPEVDRADDAAVDRLFRTLVPMVIGRRSGHEIIHRLRRKWELGHSLPGVLEAVRSRVHELADLRGPAVEVLGRLARDFEALAPESVAELRELVGALAGFGVLPERIELDLGFGRGIGFYSQMIFELIAPTPEGPVEVCGGGRYDGLARVLGSTRDGRGAGFAFGLERLLDVLHSQGRTERAPAIDPESAVILADGPDLLPAALELRRKRLQQGRRTDFLSNTTFEHAKAHANRQGLAKVLLVKRGLDRPNAVEEHDA